MTGLMSVNAYALEEKDVIGTWYVNELSMGGDILFHPGVMGMEVTVDIKEGGQMETMTSYRGEEPEADQSEWKIENDKFLITYNGETEECEYADGKITITADGTTMILSQEKEEYEPYVPGKPVENPRFGENKNGINFHKMNENLFLPIWDANSAAACKRRSEQLSIFI